MGGVDSDTAATHTTREDKNESHDEGGGGVHSTGGSNSISGNGTKSSKSGKVGKSSRLFGVSSRYHGAAGNEGDEVDEDVGSSAPSSSFTDMVNFSLKYANAYFASMAGGANSGARASYGNSGDTTGGTGNCVDDDTNKSHRPPKFVPKS